MKRHGRYDHAAFFCSHADGGSVMKIVYRLVSLVLLVIGAAIGIWVYLENMQPVPVMIFGKAIGTFPLALWLLSFFVAGTVLGLSLSGVQALRHQMHTRVLRKQIKSVKQNTGSGQVI